MAEVVPAGNRADHPALGQGPWCARGRSGLWLGAAGYRSVAGTAQFQQPDLLHGPERRLHAADRDRRAQQHQSGGMGGAGCLHQRVRNDRRHLARFHPADCAQPCRRESRHAVLS
ncbi:MAG: hypothetical protein CFE32_04800, partial [Alphaproteobacteria bacterium PA3]